MSRAVKRQTSILVNPTGTPATKATALAASSPFSNELHPLPPVHITTEDVRQDRLPKTLMDLHESIRVATMPMRQDPESAPSYVRGVQFTNTDGFLQTQYVHIQQSNGYLYFFGDDSVSVVSNVNTTGSPATTTFNYQNVDPQTGIPWRDSLLPFGRTLLFGNNTGVYGIYGGAATKVSAKL